MAIPANCDEVQRLATEGIAPMDRPGLFARFFMAVAQCAERLNQRYAKFGNPCVYDNKLFPWVAGVEANWKTIRSELDRVLERKDELPNVQDITVDFRSITKDAGWKVFLVGGLRHQVRSPISRFGPETWRIVRNIPGLKTAMFSSLSARQTLLPPHRGPYNGVLRLHLGLLVPQHDGAISELFASGPERRNWSEGSVLIF